MEMHCNCASETIQELFNGDAQNPAGQFSKTDIMDQDCKRR